MHLREHRFQKSNYNWASRIDLNQTTRRNRLGSIILAAGRSSRMGSPKMDLVLSTGETALQRLIKYHLECNFCVRLVVAGHLNIQLPQIPKSCLVINTNQEKGPLFSLQLALRTLGTVSGVLVQAVDHPLVRPDTLKILSAQHRRAPGRILVPEYRGRRGHPVLFPQRFFRDLDRAPLTIGARAITRSRPERILQVRVDDPGIHANLNTPEDLLRWRWIGCTSKAKSTVSISASPDQFGLPRPGFLP